MEHHPMCVTQIYQEANFMDIGTDQGAGLYYPYIICNCCVLVGTIKLK